MFNYNFDFSIFIKLLITHISLIKLQKLIIYKVESKIFIKFYCNFIDINYSTLLYYVLYYLKHVISSNLKKKHQ